MTFDEAILFCEEVVEKYKKAIDTEVDSMRKINCVKHLIAFDQILEWLKKYMEANKEMGTEDQGYKNEQTMDYHKIQEWRNLSLQTFGIHGL